MARIQELSTFDRDIEAIVLQLEEIDIQRGSQKGKYAEGTAHDNDIAFLYFKDELQNYLSLLNDQKLAHSLARAIDTDATTLEDLRASEYEAVQDRMLVFRLSSEDPELEKVPESENTMVDDDAEKSNDSWSGLATKILESSDDEAGPSAPYALRQDAAFNKLSQYAVECVACGEEKHPKDAISLSCKHIYCNACLKSLFIRATTDEFLFPPKCCRQPIDPSLIESKFSNDELMAFRDTAIEFTTADRVYCAAPNCGKFTPPQNVFSEVDRALCAKCEAETCVHCKNLAHDGECVANKALQALFTLATSQGWRRCIRCKTMIERDIGCNHMT